MIVYASVWISSFVREDVFHLEGNMGKVGIRELKQNTSQILRRVREEGESFDITYHGRLVARIVPIKEPDTEPVSFDEFLAEWDALAEEIGKNWPEGLTAVEAVRESRRRLE